MPPFDLSTMNVILIVAVIALFIFFITVLMKLTPSTDAEEKLRKEIEVERQEPPKTPQNAPPIQPPIEIDVSSVADKPVVAAGPARGDPYVQAKPETPSKRECLHHFGYLRKLPKNTPIPDECFGCEKIVDCFVNKKSK